MTLKLEVEYDTRTIRTTCSDIISGADLMDYELNHWSNPEYEGFDHCIDFSGALMDLFEADLFALATNSIPRNPDFLGAKTALIVADDLQAELAEFYREARHELCGTSIREIKIFRDLQTANHWLSQAYFSAINDDKKPGNTEVTHQPQPG